jgi:putative NADH-flavin reductase
LEQGHSVTALLRHPHKLDDIPQAKKDHLTIVQGDVLNANDVEKAVQGNQVIITSLGGKNVLDSSVGDASVCSQGTRCITAAQIKYKVERNIIVTSCGVGDSWNVSHAHVVNRRILIGP